MVRTGAIRLGSVKGAGSVQLCEKKGHLISDTELYPLMTPFAYSRLNSRAEPEIIPGQDSLIEAL